MTNKFLFFILLLSGLLRLYKIDGYMEFLGDQGRDVVQLSNFIKHGDLMFIGPQTSIGNMYLGPWFYYLLSPSLFISNFSPTGPAVFIALLGVLTTYMIYRVSYGWFKSHNAALFSALTFAISPVAIKYTSFIWNPNIMPLFALSTIYFLQKKNYILSAISFVMVLNSHYLGLLLIFPIIFQLHINKPSTRDFIKVLLIIFLGFLPLILFDIKHDAQNAKNIYKFFTVRQETVNLKPYKALPNIAPLFSKINSSFFLARNQQYSHLFSVTFFILLLFCFYINKQDSKLKLLLVWLGSGLVGLALYKQHLYDHYFGFIFPCLAILFGYTVTKVRLFGLLLLLPVVYFSYANSHLHKTPNYQMQQVEEVADLILSNANSADFNFALLSKSNYDPPYRYYLTKGNLYKIEDKKTSLLYVVCEESFGTCKSPVANPEYNIAAFGPAALERQWQIGTLNIFKLTPAKL